MPYKKFFWHSICNSWAFLRPLAFQRQPCQSVNGHYVHTNGLSSEYSSSLLRFPASIAPCFPLRPITSHEVQAKACPHPSSTQYSPIQTFCYGHNLQFFYYLLPKYFLYQNHRLLNTGATPTIAHILISIWFTLHFPGHLGFILISYGHYLEYRHSVIHTMAQDRLYGHATYAQARESQTSLHPAPHNPPTTRWRV